LQLWFTTAFILHHLYNVDELLNPAPVLSSDFVLLLPVVTQ